MMMSLICGSFDDLSSESFVCVGEGLLISLRRFVKNILDIYINGSVLPGSEGSGRYSVSVRKKWGGGVVVGVGGAVPCEMVRAGQSGFFSYGNHRRQFSKIHKKAVNPSLLRPAHLTVVSSFSGRILTEVDYFCHYYSVIVILAEVVRFLPPVQHVRIPVLDNVLVHRVEERLLARTGRQVEFGVQAKNPKLVAVLLAPRRARAAVPDLAE